MFFACRNCRNCEITSFGDSRFVGECQTALCTDTLYIYPLYISTLPKVFINNEIQFNTTSHNGFPFFEGHECSNSQSKSSGYSGSYKANIFMFFGDFCFVVEYQTTLRAHTLYIQPLSTLPKVFIRKKCSQVICAVSTGN